MFKLLFKQTSVAVKQGLEAPSLPTISATKTLVFSNLAIHLDQYAAMTSWPARFQHIIHPAYLAMAALNVQKPLIAHPEQPFAGLGIVHMGNNMSYRRLLTRDDKAVMTCRFGQIWEHKLGWVFAVETDVKVDEHVVMTLSSHYLSRQQHKAQHSGLPPYQPNKIAFAHDAALQPLMPQPLSIEPSLGRRYARLSGDYNPIHLGHWGAKMFGFKSAFIHGMWTKASLLSHWFAQCDDDIVDKAWDINVQFMNFVYMPGQIQFVTEQTIKPEQATYVVAGMPEYYDASTKPYILASITRT
jgi:acyl dehydratase